MKHVAIFFVPTGASQRDFEIALREHFESVEFDGTATMPKALKQEIAGNDQLPLWTWFIPNSRP